MKNKEKIEKKLQEMLMGIYTNNYKVIKDVLDQDITLLNKAEEIKELVRANDFEKQDLKFLVYNNKDTIELIQKCDVLIMDRIQNYPDKRIVSIINYFIGISVSTSLALFTIKQFVTLISAIKNEDLLILDTRVSIELGASLIALYGEHTSIDTDSIYKNEKDSNSITLSLGNFVLSIFESANFIEYRTIEKHKTKRYVTIKDAYLLLFTTTFVNKQNLPKLTRSEVYNIGNIYKYHDISNERKKLFIGSNYNMKVINYLSGTEFVINKEALSKIKLSLVDYLLENEVDYDVLETCILSLDEFLVSRQLVKHKKIGKQEHFKNQMEIARYLDTIAVAECFQNTVFYFKVSLDWRGRIYYDGYPINPQGGFISRDLLRFNLSREKVIGLDVTASGFQMLALLSTDISMLKLTKFFESNNAPDFYLHYLEKFKQHLKKQGINQTIIDQFDRKLFKGMCMKMIYGEGTYSRSQSIENYINDKDSKPYELASHFEEFFKTAAPTIFECTSDITKMLRHKLISDKNFIIALSDQYINTPMCYYKTEIKRIPCFAWNKDLKKFDRRRKSLELLKIPLKLDEQKNLRAVIPNTIHQMDALVLMEALRAYTDEKIPVYAVHDAFYTTKDMEEKAKWIYYNACLNVLRRNPMLSLIKTNEITDKKLIQKYEKSVENLLDYAKTSTYAPEILKEDL